MKKHLALILVLIFIFSVTLTGCDRLAEELFGEPVEEDIYSNHVQEQTQNNINTQTALPLSTEFGPFRLKKMCGPLYDGVTKYAGTYLFFTVFITQDVEDPTVTATVDNKDAVSITRCYLEGENTVVRLEFNQAGRAVLKLTLAQTGETETFWINVKEDYDCNPGKSKLSPEEFAYCVSSVAEANGMTLMNDTTRHYGNLALDDYELTWENARSLGQTICYQRWQNGYHYLNFVYSGEKPAGYMFRSYSNEA